MRAPRVLSIFWMLVITYAPSSAESPTTSHVYDPLLYSHLVVECTITAVHTRTVTDAQMSLPTGTPDRELGILIAELSNVTTLRGTGAPSEVMIGVDLSPRNLIGQRVILCCYWLPSLNMFTVRFDRLAFRQSDDKWVSLRPDFSLPPEDRTPLSSSDIQSMIARVGLPSLTNQAHLVVAGKIMSATESSLSSEAQTFRVKKFVLAIEEVLKGDPQQRQITFLVGIGPKYPSWYSVGPRSINPGEKWLVFLGDNAEVIYPLGGINGLLLLDGPRVMLDRVVEYPLGFDEITREIREVLE